MWVWRLLFLCFRLRSPRTRWGKMLAMDQGVVEEWLSEYKVRHLCLSLLISITSLPFPCFDPCVCVFQTLPETAVSSYAASLKDKGSLVPALYKVIRENYSDVRQFLLLFDLSSDSLIIECALMLNNIFWVVCHFSQSNQFPLFFFFFLLENAFSYGSKMHYDLLLCVDFNESWMIWGEKI